jgi:hypothetical protein
MIDPFKDKHAPKERKQQGLPWSFKAPSKDQAVSGSLSAGTNHGVGFRQPVGKEKASGYAIPLGCKRIDPNRMIDEEKE